MSKTQEPDIPIAVATAVDPSSPSGTRPSLQSPNYHGRSSRIGLSKEKSKVMDQDQIRKLQEQGFTRGLAEAMTQNNAAFPLRIWVVDNSGSMISRDGMRMVKTSNGGYKMVECTRWVELQETVECHIRFAGLLEAPTVFRLLNPENSVQQFSVAENGPDCIQQDIQHALGCMRHSPRGGTPLTEQVLEIRENVLELQPTLVEKGQKVAIILATDGVPNGSKEEFVQALRSLEGLNVWVVIRLCTDDDIVVDFYNNLDSQLELSLEVLDDFEMEGKECYEFNPFLNYALPLHRCREMGYHHRLFDLFDERKLTADEVREFLMLLFGDCELPDPHVDWDAFSNTISNMLKEEQYQWNPVTKRAEPWINMNKLNKGYGGRGGVGSVGNMKEAYGGSGGGGITEVYGGGQSRGGCGPGCSIM